MAEIAFSVAGLKCADRGEPRALLVHYLRETFSKAGAHIGCDTSNCGVCTVHLNGESVLTETALAAVAGSVTLHHGGR